MLQKATANFKFTKIISILREKGSLNLSLKKKKNQAGGEIGICKAAQGLPGSPGTAWPVELKHCGIPTFLQQS